ncbi:hypothetical protein [Methanogenium cariaci]|uniref:hypothetical protein n=1 Tax=Methanogenium cariaci TaxID=2197 RepID=UPI001FE14A95|nr:hypothetical protein [Methanogenium cariaci]
MKLFDKKKPANTPPDNAPPEIQKDEEILARVEERHSSDEGFGKFMRHPVQMLTEKPENILILTIPVAIIVFVIGLVLQVSKYGVVLALTTTGIDDYFLLAVLVAAVPPCTSGSETLNESEKSQYITAKLLPGRCRNE